MDLCQLFQRKELGFVQASKLQVCVMATSWPPVGSLRWCQPDSRSKSTTPTGRHLKLWLLELTNYPVLKVRNSKDSGCKNTIVGSRARQQVDTAMLVEPHLELWVHEITISTIWQIQKWNTQKYLFHYQNWWSEGVNSIWFQTVAGVRMVRLTEDMIVARTRVRKTFK